MYFKGLFPLARASKESEMNSEVFEPSALVGSPV